ncbi:hypothetical protein AC629_11495 [Bradyrhizobium sp. NAS80.1]|nr:hypothetical protein AC629_11495 [Bradyrhizobium sp. NAS80.1]
MSKGTSMIMMLEEEIKLHGFAGISPVQSLTHAARHREAMVAADQSVIIRCYGDDFAGFINDDFHAPPPMQRPSEQPQWYAVYLTSCRPPSFQP